MIKNHTKNCLKKILLDQVQVIKDHILKDTRKLKRAPKKATKNNINEQLQKRRELNNLTHK